MTNNLKLPKPEVILALFIVTSLNSTFYEYHLVLSKQRNSKHEQFLFIFNTQFIPKHVLIMVYQLK